MPCATPTRPLESSAKRLLKKVHMCTERSFVCTPLRNGAATRKATVPDLSETFASGITLLSVGDETIVGNSTFIDQTQISLDRTLTETKKKVCVNSIVEPSLEILSFQLTFDETTLSTPWEVINSTMIDQSDYTVISANDSNVSQATVISKKSTKGKKTLQSLEARSFMSSRLHISVSASRPSLLSRILKPATPKALNNSVKFVNRFVRDIDRLNDTFGQEWVTLPNFV